MRMVVLVLSLVLLLVSPALSADFACFDSARPLGTQFRYLTSVESSAVTSPLCFKIPPEQTDAQRTLVAQTPTHAGAQCTQMSCYLKVVGGLAVEMTAAEKQAVDDKLAADAAYRAQFSDELATQEYCNTLTLQLVNDKVAQIKATIRADIIAAPTTPEKIEEVIQAFEKTLTAMEKVARCQISALRLRMPATLP